ncbi:helix-turn-helix domain-containing protein [Deinococcus marmoris]|uniref:helix-turn-helix domain-containing protein n=1 Tax=Deinococcus marmoris TaxID=249408 RepID=UPI00068A0907|nr:helix-turn-helix domain-containing protein [Deinococcus marmoris]
MTNPYLSDIDVFAELDALAGDSLETRTVDAQEWLRLKLTEVMIGARKRAGLTQTELAKRMGIGQARISKLENANNDRTVDSVAAYLAAVDAEMLMTVRQDGQIQHVTRDCWPIELPYRQDKVRIFHKKQDFEWKGQVEIEMSPKNLVMEAA